MWLSPETETGKSYVCLFLKALLIIILENQSVRFCLPMLRIRPVYIFGERRVFAVRKCHSL